MIDTYTKLQEAVWSEANRPDLASQAPLFISLAENEIERLLADTWMLEKSATIAVLAGATEIPLPADLIALNHIGIIGSKPLRIIDESERASGDYSFWPEAASLVGRTVLMANAFGADANVRMTYKAKIAPLETAGTNTVFQQLPDLYLYASVAALERYVKNEAGYSAYMGMAAKALRDYMAVAGYRGTNNYHILSGVV